MACDNSLIIREQGIFSARTGNFFPDQGISGVALRLVVLGHIAFHLLTSARLVPIL
jgi:hypothetical protein